MGAELDYIDNGSSVQSKCMKNSNTNEVFAVREDHESQISENSRSGKNGQIRQFLKFLARLGILAIEPHRLNAPPAWVPHERRTS